MAQATLKDPLKRDALQFLLWPRLPYAPRMAAALGLILAGVAVQLVPVWPHPMPLLLAGLPLLLAGTLLLCLRGYDTSKPVGALRNKTWEKTTRDRFDAVFAFERKVRRWDDTAIDITCVPGALMMLGFGIGVAVLGLVTGERWFWIVVVDGSVLLLPHWFTGTRRGWRPVTLVQQVKALNEALKVVETMTEPPCQIQPMMEMAGRKDARAPVGARVFIRFPDGPEDFLGLQLQVALNTVKGTHFPYLYAVVIARQSFKLAFPPISYDQTLTLETKREDEVDVLVIRQKTTKTSGYHTNPKAIAVITHAAWRTVQALLEHRSGAHQ
ncbi:MAG: hypothetical protein H6842_10505 [Rhodospirillaceae bacterium]|nr:hypothetical protein [Rhodospirillaceae bacterium]